MLGSNTGTEYSGARVVLSLCPVTDYHWHFLRRIFLLVCTNGDFGYVGIIPSLLRFVTIDAIAPLDHARFHVDVRRFETTGRVGYDRSVVAVEILPAVHIGLDQSLDFACVSVYRRSSARNVS